MHLTDQIGGTITLSTSFLHHKGVFGTILIPVLTEEVTTLPPTRRHWVHTFIIPVPEQDMLALQSGGGLSRRYRTGVGHGTHAARILVS
jgi:hypothetical protein